MWTRSAADPGHRGQRPLTGTSGDDVIDALAGDDRVNAGAGNDRIVGGGERAVTRLTEGPAMTPSLPWCLMGMTWFAEDLVATRSIIRGRSPRDHLALRFFRFLTGAGIGGESAAINSIIQELVQARVRG